MGNSLKRHRTGNSSVVGRLVQNKSVPDLVRSSWERCKSACPLLPGAYILKEIFELEPKVKTIFRLEHIKNSDDLLNCNSFMRHASVFTNVLELVLRNLNSMETEISPTLVILGRRHLYKHEIGFRLEYLELFNIAMIAYVTQYDCNVKEGTTLYCAWLNVAQFVVHKVREGHELERRHKTGVMARFKPHSSS